MNEPVATNFVTLTGNLPGAIATTVLWGDRAAEVLQRVFLPRTKQIPAEWPLGEIRYGRWRFQRRPDSDSVGDANSAIATGSELGEDLVVSRLGLNEFEIQSHAGFAVQIIRASLIWAGAQDCSPKRYLQTRRNRWVAEVEMAMLAAATQRTSKLLLQQWWLWQKWGPLFDHVPLAESCRLWLPLQRQWARWGQHLTEPYRVVFCGVPNVGKSSLINACLGYQRSIVHELPGTTRDVVHQVTAIEGWPVILSDTAGIRDTDHPIEAEGVERAKQQIQQADCFVWVRDPSEPTGPAETDLTRLGRVPDLLVWNKSDLLLAPVHLPANGLLTSAATGAGMDSLLQAISQRLVSRVPPDDLPIPVTGEMNQWLAELESR